MLFCLINGQQHIFPVLASKLEEVKTMSLHEHHKRRMEQRINEFEAESDQAIAGLGNLKLHTQSFLDNLPRDQAKLKTWYLSNMKQLDEYIDMLVEFNLSLSNLEQIHGVTSYNSKTRANQLCSTEQEQACQAQENQARQALQATRAIQANQAKLTTEAKQATQSNQSLRLYQTDQRILECSRTERMKREDNLIAFSSGSCSAESVSKEIGNLEVSEGPSLPDLPRQPNLEGTGEVHLSSTDGVSIWLVADMDQLAKLMEEMNEHYRIHKEVITYAMPAVGYCAYYDDATDSYMRAMYIQGEEEITLVDTGDRIPLVPGRMRRLNTRFWSVPALAHLCHLEDVDIPDDEDTARRIAKYLNDHLWEPFGLEVVLTDGDSEDNGVNLYFKDGTTLNELVRQLISTVESSPKNFNSQPTSPNCDIQPSQKNGDSQPLPLNGDCRSSQNAAPGVERAAENWGDLELSELNKELDANGPEYENPLEAVTGYSNRDEFEICKHYKGGPDRTCFKGARCKKKHIVHHPDGHTLDKIPAAAGCRPPPLPAPGSCCKVKVTHVQDVGHFYVQFEEKDEFMTLAQLVEEMTREAPNAEPLQLEPALGELVAARYTDGCWYRARVTGLPNQQGHTEVLYIDYGNSCPVPGAWLRALAPRWSATAARAARARLAGLAGLAAPAGADHTFREMVLDRTLQARIIARAYDEVTVELIDLEGFKVADLLAVTCGVSLEPYQVEDDSRRDTCLLPA